MAVFLLKGLRLGVRVRVTVSLRDRFRFGSRWNLEVEHFEPFFLSGEPGRFFLSGKPDCFFLSGKPGRFFYLSGIIVKIWLTNAPAPIKGGII